MANKADESESMTDEDIDLLNMPAAIRMCKKHSIDIKSNIQGSKIELYKIKYLIKYELLCKGFTRAQTVSFLNARSSEERARKEALSEVYEETLAFCRSLRSMRDPVVQELDKIFPCIQQHLTTGRLKVLDDVAPVLVLGETGSGKSSFINLLLGEDILPCSLLSNTHAVCEIRYSERRQYRAQLIPTRRNGAGREGAGSLATDAGDFWIVHDDMDTFKQQFAEYVQAVHTGGQPVYELCRIYAPCDILQSGLMLVDSPGVGETQQMEDMVMDYVMNAAAFIYVIDSTNAGGMQLRVERLVQEVYKKTLANITTDNTILYRPQIALFVCNKWDEVETADRAEVLKDTCSKIMKVWPGCKQHQIIPFSAVEAQVIQDKDALTPKFREVLENIQILLPQAQEMVILKGYRQLQQYISRCITTFESHLEYIKLSMEDREKKRTVTKQRLEQLNARLSTFFKSQKDALDEDVDKLALSLKSYLTETDSMNAVCRFNECEIPDGSDWQKFAVQVRLKVYENLRTLIKQWEANKNLTEGTVKRIEQAMETEFPGFEAEIYQVEREMMGKKECLETLDVLEEDQEPDLLPEFIRKTFSGLSTGTKFVLGIGLSPILLAGIVIRLPYVGVLNLDKFFTKKWMESKFKEAAGDRKRLKQVCESYAEKTVKSITDKLSLKAIIEEDMQVLFHFVEGQKQRMQRQIKLDMDLLQKLKTEEREDKDIERVYEPLNVKCKVLMYQLKHFMLMNNPSHLPWIRQITDLDLGEEIVCTGIMADIVQARARHPAVPDRGSAAGHHDNVCVRRQKDKVQYADTMKYIKVLEAYTFSRKSKGQFVECYGVWSPGGKKKRLYQVFEPLQCSLRQLLLRPDVDFENNKYNNFLAIMSRIVEGLDFLHDRKLVHFDLSLNTVAIDIHGNVKLTNISQERPLNIAADISSDIESEVKKHIHLNPKFFTQEHLRTMYGRRDDMYSVGIIMWQMWSSDPSGDGLTDILTHKVFSDTRKSPKTAAKDNRKSPLAWCLYSATDEGSQCEHVQAVRWHLEQVPHVVNLHYQELASQDNRDLLTHHWWNLMRTCVHTDVDMTARDWLKTWRGHHGYPQVTIVYQSQT